MNTLNEQIDSLASPEVLSAIFAWYASETGRTEDRRQFKNCLRRVRTIYRAIAAWYGPGRLEVELIRLGPAAVGSLVRATSNSDFRWTLRGCRSELEREAVMVGATSHKITRAVKIDWIYPAQPIDRSVAHPIGWRGDLLDPEEVAEDFRRAVKNTCAAWQGRKTEEEVSRSLLRSREDFRRAALA